MGGDQRQEGLSTGARRVLDVLEAGGPEMPIVVLARACGLPPTSLTWLLDELHDAGYVEPGSERRSVRAVRADAGGRFRRHTGAPAEPVEAERRDG